MGGVLSWGFMSCGALQRAEESQPSENLGNQGLASMSEFPLQSRKASQPVRAFVEEMTGVTPDPFPFDVLPDQERIDLFYQVEVLEEGASSCSIIFSSQPV